MEKQPQSFDICIVCALYKEASAVIDEFSRHCHVSFTKAFSGLDHYVYQYTTIQNTMGEPLTILVTWLPETGTTAMILEVKSLVQQFHPRFMAMTGTCAGDRHKVQLGDLIIASAAYYYEEGKITSEPERHQPPTHMFSPSDRVLQYVRGFSSWEKPVTQMKEQFLKQDLQATDLPKSFIAVMASGMAVRSDDPFPWLREHFRNTVALDMEAASFYAALRSFPFTQTLVVKGVSDYADMWKHDDYHDYAARASAVYLLHFIQEYITEQTMPRQKDSDWVGPKTQKSTYRNVTNFSDMLKMLRVRAGLTQSEEANLLGVSVRTFQSWESGVSIPQQAERLKQLIEALLMQDVFPGGREQEEAEVLWELARKNTPFDVEWFKKLLAQKTSPYGVSIFYCFAREDELLRDELEKRLSLLQRQAYIAEWHDRCIVPGTDWEVEIDSHLIRASVVLLLVSPDFLASDYVYGIEMKLVLERHKAGKTQVIPIILRSADWFGAPFAHLQALPRDGKPVTTWENIDVAFSEVSKGVRRVIEELRTSEFVEPVVEGRLPNYPPHFYQLYEVFVKSGVPKVTFVEREDFELLKLSLAQPGRGVVIEGPSGIGKTTAIEKAVEALLSRRHIPNSEAAMQILSARNPEHCSKLQTIRQWHLGTVIIDDFHRLDPQLQKELIDYLKYLADTEPLSKKLVIVGIPQTGQTLVNASFDVATRIDVFKLGLVSDELLLHMVEKGEKALNIKFDRKAGIVLAAGGSLNIAQFLCFNICYHERVIETQKEPRLVSCDIDAAVIDVLKSLSRKFGESIKRFVAMGEPKDSTALMLLEDLASSEDGFLSLTELKSRRPGLARGIMRLLNEGWMNKLYSEYSACANHLFFDQTALTLVIDDPQLAFYLKKIQFSMLSREAGKGATLAQRKVFISYSHKDAKWLERLRVHLTPIERDGIIDLWDDTKIVAGAQWKEAILEALETARVAVALVSANFLASDFIAQHELPELLSRAAAGGTVILPIIISPCLFDKTGLSIFQTVNPPDKPLSAMTSSDRERVWVNVAEDIRKRLTIDAV